MVDPKRNTSSERDDSQNLVGSVRDVGNTIETTVQGAIAPLAAREHTLVHGRADVDSYTSYYAGMDATQAQKVALSTAHMPNSGAVVYDLGFGTGLGTYDLARLYPENQIIGIDIDPNSLKHANERYQAENLRFLQGDISEIVLPAESADVVFCSSILHEVLSYAPIGRFDPRHLHKVLDANVAMLKTGGMYIVRDFIAAPWPQHVYLDLKSDDGTVDGPFARRSSVALFKHFTENFQCRAYPNGGIDRDTFELGELRPGWQRFLVPGRIAQEFILRRQYTKRWMDEMKEEYTYASQSEFEEMFAKRGLRLIVAQEVHNPWIRANWFEGNYTVANMAGNCLSFPPTNFLIVGEKVGPGLGVRIKETATSRIDQPRYLTRRCFKRTDGDSPQVFDLIGRPGNTTDFLPYFEDPSQDGLKVLVKSGYPRPLLRSDNKNNNLDNATSGGYTLEVLNLVSDATSDEELSKGFSECSGLAPDRFTLHESGYPAYFPSPGTSDEVVSVRRVKLGTLPAEGVSLPRRTPFSTSGELRLMDSRQALRAFQVGGMSDPRLEINLYRLHLDQRVPVGRWIGLDIKPTLQGSALLKEIGSAKELLQRKRRIFSEVPLHESPEFFELYAGLFTEYDQSGKIVGNSELEYVVPRRYSSNTATVIPYAKLEDGRVVVFLEDRDLPAVQVKTDSSSILTLPAFRLDKRTTTTDEMTGEVVGRMLTDFGVSFVRPPAQLGGKLNPSLGFSPETVYMLAGEVNLSAGRPSNSKGQLHAVLLQDILENQHSFTDAQLLTGVLRLAHSLGEIS